MSSRTRRIVGLAVLAAFMGMPSAAQVTEWQIDPGHSAAYLWLGYGGETLTAAIAGVAQVSGRARLDPKDPAASTLDLCIYPWGQTSRLLGEDGLFKDGAYANLARYTLLRFHSDRATLLPSGDFEFSGDLSVTQVQYETTGDWNLAFSGTRFGEPQATTTMRRATFLVPFPAGHRTDAPTRGRASSPSSDSPQPSATSTLRVIEFPELPAALTRALWPFAAEDAHCNDSPPDPNGRRDYTSTGCRGKLLDPPSPEFRRGGTGLDYSGFSRTPPGPVREVFIDVHMTPAPRAAN